jgi:hypothetical protein
MLKFMTVSGAMLLSASVALAATNVDVRVNAPAPPSVNVQVGAPPAPRIVERERVIVKEKGDRGKHKGHYKHKKHKKHKD